MKGGLQQIKYTEQICKNEAQQAYSTQTSKTYKELYACFANGLPIASTIKASAGTWSLYKKLFSTYCYPKFVFIQFHFEYELNEFSFENEKIL